MQRTAESQLVHSAGACTGWPPKQTLNLRKVTLKPIPNVKIISLKSKFQVEN